MKNKEILDTFSQKEIMYKMAKKAIELSEGIIKTVKITVSNESETHHSEVKVRLFWSYGDEVDFEYQKNSKRCVRHPINEVEELLRPFKEQMDKEIKEVCSYCDEINFYNSYNCDKINFYNSYHLMDLYEEKYGKQ